MFARKCDRCGRLYENYFDVNGSAIYTFNRDDMGQALENEVFVKDLCPDCMEKFHRFMDGGIVIEPVEYEVLHEIEVEKEVAEREAEDKRFAEYEELGKTSDVL